MRRGFLPSLSRILVRCAALRNPGRGSPKLSTLTREVKPPVGRQDGNRGWGLYTQSPVEVGQRVHELASLRITL